MMLLLRLTHHFHLMAARRRIDDALDAYFTALKQMAWPRLHSMLDAHAESLTTAQATTRDVHPHYVRLHVFLLQML